MVKVLHQSHTQRTVNVFSEFDPSLGSSGQPQRSVQGPTPHSKLVLQSRVLTNTIHVFLMV